MNLFFSGLVAGFSVAAPIGPVSLLCINQMLARGSLRGFSTALGASTADTIYGVVAALGLTMVTSFSTRYHTTIQMLGGVLIILIGLYQFLISRRAATHPGECGEQSVARGFILVFTSTLSNPFTVCFFISVFSAFAGAGNSYRTAFFYAAGIFFGTAAWWLLLSLVIGFFKKALSEKNLVLIRQISAVLIVALGVYALLR